MASLCHPFTTTNLSYRFPIFETSATALCGTTGNDNSTTTTTNNNNNMYEYINIWIWFKTMLSCGDFIQAISNTRLQTSSNRLWLSSPMQKVVLPTTAISLGCLYLFPDIFSPTHHGQRKKTAADAGAPDSTLAQRLHGAHSIASIWGVPSKNWMGGLEEYMDGVIFLSWWFPWDWSIGRFR